MADRRVGKVKWYSPKGYGYISDGLRDDYHVSVRDVAGRYLRAGFVVEFEPSVDPQRSGRRLAINVRRIVGC